MNKKEVDKELSLFSVAEQVKYNALLDGCEAFHNAEEIKILELLNGGALYDGERIIRYKVCPCAWGWYVEKMGLRIKDLKVEYLGIQKGCTPREDDDEKAEMGVLFSFLSDLKLNFREKYEGLMTYTYRSNPYFLYTARSGKEHMEFRGKADRMWIIDRIHAVGGLKKAFCGTESACCRT